MRCPCCGQGIHDPELIDYLRQEDEELIKFRMEGEEEWVIGAYGVMPDRDGAVVHGGKLQLQNLSEDLHFSSESNTVLQKSEDVSR